VKGYALLDDLPEWPRHYYQMHEKPENYAESDTLHHFDSLL
jgi:hypothetical protein